MTHTRRGDKRCPLQKNISLISRHLQLFAEEFLMLTLPLFGAVLVDIRRNHLQFNSLRQRDFSIPLRLYMEGRVVDTGGGLVD